MNRNEKTFDVKRQNTIDRINISTQLQMLVMIMYRANIKNEIGRFTLCFVCNFTCEIR